MNFSIDVVRQWAEEVWADLRESRLAGVAVAVRALHAPALEEVPLPLRAPAGAARELPEPPARLADVAYGPADDTAFRRETTGGPAGADGTSCDSHGTAGAIIG